MKRSLLLLFAVAGGLLFASAAAAVTGSRADGDAHPNVGALLVETPSGRLAARCSGTLIAPAVFLTAAHCTAGLPSARVWATFASALGDRGSPVIAGTARTHPAFGHDRADPADLAVVLLDTPATGLTAATLPSAGLLESFGRATPLVAVGYGYSDRATGGGPPRFVFDGLRRTATTELAALAPALVRTLTGDGGACFGDSGGPLFAAASGTLVAVTSSGDAACAGMSAAYRLDTPSARAFLQPFVALP